MATRELPLILETPDLIGRIGMDTCPLDPGFAVDSAPSWWPRSRRRWVRRHQRVTQLVGKDFISEEMMLTSFQRRSYCFSQLKPRYIHDESRKPSWRPHCCPVDADAIQKASTIPMQRSDQRNPLRQRGWRAEFKQNSYGGHKKPEWKLN